MLRVQTLVEACAINVLCFQHASAHRLTVGTAHALFRAPALMASGDASALKSLRSNPLLFAGGLER